MIPHSFDYHVPDTLEGALAALHRYGDEAKLMAGGQSLLPMMKFRLVNPAHVIDLWRIKTTRALQEAEGEVLIDPLATHRTLAESELLRRNCPILARAAELVGDVQVRNIGTIGGSIAHADPAANYSPVLVALGAKFELRSSTSERVVSAGEFYQGIFATALEPTEMITKIRIPIIGDGTGWEYYKLRRRAQDFALVGVAVLLKRDKSGNCSEARVVLGSVHPTPTQMEEVEKNLRERPLDKMTVDSAARATALGDNVASDVHADAEYRRDVAPVCVRRALEAAASRMGIQG